MVVEYNPYDKKEQTRFVDFRNLNLATPKDEYVMPIVDMFANKTSTHGILTFMDKYSGYN